MKRPRLLYLATADARGHLMRAQLLTHALQAQGAAVEVITTSVAGARFLHTFGIQASVLSPHYAVQFDARQNMRAAATDANVAAYLLHPARLLRDVLQLQRRLREVDLVLNDSFHPALLVMGMLPVWRHKIVQSTAAACAPPCRAISRAGCRACWLRCSQAPSAGRSTAPPRNWSTTSRKHNHRPADDACGCQHR